MKRYLKHITIKHYSALKNRKIGFFDPGLNVIYGPNESGKSSTASFIKSVLFGWEDEPGVKNHYIPQEGESPSKRSSKSPSKRSAKRLTKSSGKRSGSLTWASVPASSSTKTPKTKTTETKTTRDEEGASGDMSVIDDIQASTFDALFSFSADTLHDLRDSSQANEQLLTAETANVMSPAQIYVELEQRIANTSVYELESDLEQQREEVRREEAELELTLQRDRELRELKRGLAHTQTRLNTINTVLETLTDIRGQMLSLQKRAEQLEKALSFIESEKTALEKANQFDVDHTSNNPSDRVEEDNDAYITEQLLRSSSDEQRAIKDKLEDFSEQHEKAVRMLDRARENTTNSKVAYEALRELDDSDEQSTQRSYRFINKNLQAVISVLLPVVFVLAGIPVFIHGRQINSLSVSALGVGLVVTAVFLAAAAFMLLFRQPNTKQEREEKCQDAQWVMLQDEKKLAHCEKELNELNERITHYMESVGLGSAAPSLRQAKELLQEADKKRKILAENEQKITSLQVRYDEIQHEQESTSQEEKRLLAHVQEEIDRYITSSGDATDPAFDELLGKIAQCRDLSGGLKSSTSPATASQASQDAHSLKDTLLKSLASVIEHITGMRDTLLHETKQMSERQGHLKAELSAAQKSRSFSEAKFRCQKTFELLREAKREFIELLLAQRILERTMTVWEHKTRPEVYEQAGALLSLMTDGSWCALSSNDDGEIVAVAADGTQRDVHHLSLGTRQQLYLSLRIALLLLSEDLGPSLPVLADDILVNFDAERREGAARALALLAKQRQVIVFTCHKETCAALKKAHKSCCVVELSA